MSDWKRAKYGLLRSWPVVGNSDARDCRVGTTFPSML